MKKPNFTLIVLGILALTSPLNAITDIKYTSLVTLQADIIQASMSNLGVRYVYTGVSPSGGFDCSGFIYYVYKQFAPDIPRGSKSLAMYGKAISKSQIRPGDLLFYATGSNPKEISHVALYIGQNSVIHATSAGPKTGIIVTDLDERYWKARFHSARRVVFDEHLVVQQEKKGEVYKIRYANGVYEGTTLNGEPHGKGKMILKNGDVYEGNFSEGVFQGAGKYVSSSGTSFEGLFEKGAISPKALKTHNSKNPLPKVAPKQPSSLWDNYVGPDFPEDWER